jgi:hypothetical protein
VNKHLELVHRLNDQTFQTRDIERATYKTSHAFTNLRTKTQLKLCSAPTIQGSPRKFCLIDYYQVGLAFMLSEFMTVGDSVEIVNDLLFGAHAPLPGGGSVIGRVPLQSEAIESQAAQATAVRNDIFSAPDLYYDRANPAGDWWVSKVSIGSLSARMIMVIATIGEPKLSDFVYVNTLNVTRHLNALDESMAKVVFEMEGALR